jgi:hypothetical protein
MYDFSFLIELAYKNFAVQEQQIISALIVYKDVRLTIRFRYTVNNFVHSGLNNLVN